MHTMLSKKRLYALFRAARDVFAKGKDGCLVECGVAGGGSLLLMALVARAAGNREKRIWAFDSFQGMPPPGEGDLTRESQSKILAWGAGTCLGTEIQVKHLLKHYRVRSQVNIKAGWFERSLKAYSRKIPPIALLHVDADWHDSTKAILDNLYDAIVPGGYIQIDDYGYWPGCKKAVDSFLKKRRIKIAIENIDGVGVFFKKPS
jgi:hypothetical protein